MRCALNECFFCRVGARDQASGEQADWTHPAKPGIHTDTGAHLVREDTHPRRPATSGQSNSKLKNAVLSILTTSILESTVYSQVKGAERLNYYAFVSPKKDSS